MAAIDDDGDDDDEFVNNEYTDDDDDCGGCEIVIIVKHESPFWPPNFIEWISGFDDKNRYIVCVDDIRTFKWRRNGLLSIVNQINH